MVDIGAKTDYDAETETVIPRVDLTEQTAPAPGTLRLSMLVSSPGPGACEFQSKGHLGIIYNFKFNRNETSRDGLRQYGDPDVETKRACCHGGSESLRQANGLVFRILEHSINVILI